MGHARKRTLFAVPDTHDKDLENSAQEDINGLIDSAPIDSFPTEGVPQVFQ